MSDPGRNVAPAAEKAEEWKTVTLDEITTRIGDGLHGTPKYEIGGKYPFINGNNLKNGKITETEKTRYVGLSEYEKHRKELSSNSILVSINGTLGNIALYHDEKVILGKSACYINLIDSVDRQFIRYCLETHDFQYYIDSQASGTTIKNASLKLIRNYEFKLPPLAEQKRIAHILGTLDDKIELNRRMNETLEAMAQALFKSWFIDFDPVIDNAILAGNPIPESLSAKAETRRKILGERSSSCVTTKDGATSAMDGAGAPSLPDPLFPNSFTETEELGWVPEGWEVGAMSDHAIIEMGQSPKGSTYNTDGEGTPLVNGPVEFGPYFTNKTKWTTAPTKFSKAGDLIVCVRGSTTGRYVKSDGEYCLGRGVCSIRAKHSQAFVDLAFRSNITEMLGLTTGSTFPNWSRQTLSKFDTIIPPIHLVESFEKIISSNFNRIIITNLESETLTIQRNTLLRKLISDRLSLSEAINLTQIKHYE